MYPSCLRVGFRRYFSMNVRLGQHYIVAYPITGRAKQSRPCRLQSMLLSIKDYPRLVSEVDEWWHMHSSEITAQELEAHLKWQHGLSVDPL